MTQVIIPPVLNEIFRGIKFENPFAGLTTFAAMFVDRVAMVNAMSATTTVAVEGYGIRNRRTKNNDRSGCHGYTDEREERHRCGQTDELTHCLVPL